MQVNSSTYNKIRIVIDECYASKIRELEEDLRILLSERDAKIEEIIRDVEHHCSTSIEVDELLEAYQ